MKSHAQNAALIDVPVEQAVSGYEEMPLYVIDGWRGGGGLP
jgi:hypothetical protein